MISKYIHFKPLSTGFQICIAKGILTCKQLKLLTLEFLYFFFLLVTFRLLLFFFKKHVHAAVSFFSPCHAIWAHFFSNVRINLGLLYSWGMPLGLETSSFFLSFFLRAILISFAHLTKLGSREASWSCMSFPRALYNEGSLLTALSLALYF